MGLSERGSADRGRFGGSHGGGPRGGGHRKGRRFSGEELRLLVLGQLEQEPRHGYQIIRSFAEKTGEAYSPSPGVLYPLLTMLQDMELVAEVEGTGAGRRSFALTDAGKAEVEAGRETLAALDERLAAMNEEASRTDAGPVRRAMMNLRMAAMNRLGREGAEESLVFDAAAIIDEAAQRIERL